MCNQLIYFYRLFIIFYLFVYSWLHWVFAAVCGLSLVAVSGGYSLVLVYRLLIVVASLVASMDSRNTGFSSCSSWALECGLGSWGTQA